MKYLLIPLKDMKIQMPQDIDIHKMNSKLAKRYSKFCLFINALNEKELPDEFVERYNEQIQLINWQCFDNNSTRKQIKRTHNYILSHVMKEAHLYPKNYFLAICLSIGLAMGAGLSGVLQNIFDLSLFAGSGIPFGMVAGLLIGYSIDKKKAKEGKQFNYE